MVDSNQGLNHHVINEFDKIGKSLLIAIGNFEQVLSFFSFSSDKVHGFLFDLLSELHLVFFLNFLEITFFVDVVLDFAYDIGHFACDDIFVLRGGAFSDGLLFEVEVSFLPCSIFRYSGGDGSILLQVK